jgi:transposase
MSEALAVDEHAEVIALRQKVDELEAQIEWFKKQIFGQKSEHAEPVDMNQLSLFSQQLEDAQAALATTEPEIPVKSYTCKKHKKSSEKLGPDVETIEKTIDITDEQRKCAPGWKVVSIGRREMRTSATYVSAKVIKTVYYVRTYKKFRVDGEGNPEFLQAKLPNAAIPRSVATSSILSKVIHDKYELDVPLYRQLQDWKRIGLTVSKTTLSNWMIVSAELLAPLYDRIHQCLMRQKFFQGDETPTQVLKENGRKATDKSYMWVA